MGIAPSDPHAVGLAGEISAGTPVEEVQRVKRGLAAPGRCLQKKDRATVVTHGWCFRRAGVVGVVFLPL